VKRVSAEALPAANWLSGCWAPALPSADLSLLRTPRDGFCANAVLPICIRGSVIHASSNWTWRALQLIARYPGFYDVLGVESVETARLVTTLKTLGDDYHPQIETERALALTF